MRSPSRMFDSLKQGDPQAIAVTAVLFFLLSVCWFSYTFLVPPKNEALPLGDGGFRAPPPDNERPLYATIENQRGFPALEGDVNPFHRDPPRRRRPRPKPTPEPTEKPRPKPEPQQPPVKPPQQEPEPPKAETVTYVYKGVLTRPDGVSVALVSTPKDGTSRYVTAGDSLPPFTVGRITPREVELTRQNDPIQLLLRGEPQTYERPSP